MLSNIMCSVHIFRKRLLLDWSFYTCISKEASLQNSFPLSQLLTEVSVYICVVISWRKQQIHILSRSCNPHETRLNVFVSLNTILEAILRKCSASLVFFPRFL